MLFRSAHTGLPAELRCPFQSAGESVAAEEAVGAVDCRTLGVAAAGSAAPAGRKVVDRVALAGSRLQARAVVPPSVASRNGRPPQMQMTDNSSLVPSAAAAEGDGAVAAVDVAAAVAAVEDVARGAGDVVAVAAFVTTHSSHMVQLLRDQVPGTALLRTICDECVVKIGRAHV